MALFNFGKDKKVEEVPETVIAYLEDAQRVRAPITVLDARKKFVSGTIQGLDEGEGSMTLQVGGAPGAEKGAKVDMVFMADSLRLGLSTKVLEVRPAGMVLELPEDLSLQERRSTPRVRLNPKEGATLTALTNLFEGVGISGLLENISQGGCRVRVEKAISIKDEKRLPMGEALFPVGQPFMLLKLNKVPKCTAVMELSGKVAYLESGMGGLVVGIAFEQLRSDHAAMIRNLVSSRSMPIPSSVPPKTRRRMESLVEDRPLPSRPLPAEEQPASKPKLETPPSPVAALPEAAAGPTTPPEPPPPQKNAALLRLKKRSRAVVALVSSAAHGLELSTFLESQGYGRVLPVWGLPELREALRQPNLGLLLLDSDIPFSDLMEEVDSLQEEFHSLPPIVLGAEEVSRAVVIAAHQAGIRQVVVKPYALDEAFNSMLEDLLE